ncbi:DUF624 domain-containing protein [Amphibacillus sp. MSJ-3]|uniref:YesL family protein n=1 Tax=Amphibacillus sp. MSJ-3 TaxID=2841505 RepID=UPI001C0F0ADC|nr:DUF624 domain-containing protein [Amphibacillus sp. MSJ-3]MBU5593929.1 DUF624 domain-containing protein [Amphibacillus sp. MSJ-3]
MKELFNLEHPLWKMMSLLSDFMLLTIIWILFSLPLITIGPSLIAFFHVGVILNQKAGRGVIREFITTFKNNFKSSFWIGMLVLFLGVVMSVNLWYFHVTDGSLTTFFFFVFLFLSICLISFFLYLFPYLAIFKGSIKEIMMLAFYSAIRHFKWTLFMFVINGTILFITFYPAPYLVFFTIGGIAYLDAKVILMLVEDYNYTSIRPLQFKV